MLTDSMAAIEAWPWIAAIRRSAVIYPLVNATHIAGLSLLFGAIAVYDLRVLRHGSDQGFSQEISVARFGFAIAAATGLVLFGIRATHYAENVAMQAKLVLITLALLNAVLFDRVSRATVRAARAGAAASFSLWLAVIFTGRFIGFA